MPLTECLWEKGKGKPIEIVKEWLFIVGVSNQACVRSM